VARTGFIASANAAYSHLKRYDKVLTLCAIAAGSLTVLDFLFQVDILNTIVKGLDVSVLFFLLVRVIFWAIALFFPRPAQFPQPRFTHLPAPPASREGFQYRTIAASQADEGVMRPIAPGVEPWVDLSEQLGVGFTNEGLDRETRRRLYTSWFSWNPNTFLRLDLHDSARGTVETVAVSIVLPLTRDGYRSLIEKATRVIDFRQSDVAEQSKRFEALLIDTLIVAPGRVRRLRSENKDHKGYMDALVLCHIGRFWTCTRQSDGSIKAPPMKLLAETSEKHLIKTIRDGMGFRQIGETKIGAPLFEFRYPKDVTTALKMTYKQVVRSVADTNDWPIQ